MKRAYEKPIALASEDLMEGVYMTSGGGGGSDCYTTGAYIHQTPETGRENYVIQFDAKHAAKDNHNSSAQELIMYFNQPVTFVSAQGKLKSGDGTNTLHIDYSYWNNPHDNIGLGDLVVKSAAGLAITDSELICNRDGK